LAAKKISVKVKQKDLAPLVFKNNIEER